MSNDDASELTPNKPRYERERKFLVDDVSIIDQQRWHLLGQGYALSSEGFEIRIRVVQSPLRSGEYEDMLSMVTTKGRRYGDERLEYEMDIPIDLGWELVRRCEIKIEKRRYQVPWNGQTWEVDQFLGANEGLYMAEIEGAHARDVSPPPWTWKEVTLDDRFSNANLARNPVSKWPEPEDWKRSSPWDWD